MNRDYGKKGAAHVRAKSTYGGQHGKLRAHYADGGDVSEAELKAEGLKASANEDVGFFKRLSMGNIDDPSSEAYKRFGAGRGRLERTPNESPAETARLSRTEDKPASITAADFQRTDKDTTPVPMPVSNDEFRRSEKDTTPVPTPSAAPAAKPAVRRVGPRAAAPAPAPAKRAEPDPEPRKNTTAGDFQRTDKDRAPVPTYDRNRPDTRPAVPQSERDKINAESFERVPLVRGVKAVADWFSKPHGPKITRNPDDMPAMYSGTPEEWAAYRARQQGRAAYRDGGKVMKGRKC